MTTANITVRAFALGDLPLLHRLKSHGISLDSEEYLSRGLRTASDAALARLSMSTLGTPTLVARQAKTQALGQFRLKIQPEAAAKSAHIVFVAPSLVNGYTTQQESLWLAMLDALSHEAGSHGAQHIHAEVDENSPVFETLRRAGFASYARQDIWRRTPDAPLCQPGAGLRWAEASDCAEIRLLHAQTVPRMAQQTDPAPSTPGLIFRVGTRTVFYLAVSIGERGVYIRPYIRLEDSAQAVWVLGAALSMIKQAAKLPVYCCVRQYQEWLGSALADQGFTPWARQTVLVKHTSVRVEHPAFAPLPNVKGGMTLPGSSATRYCAGHDHQEGLTCLKRAADAEPLIPRQDLKGSVQ